MASELKATPGPWEVIAGDWDKELGGYCRYTIKPLRMLNMADAKLIAASWELYHALDILASNWPRHRDGMDNKILPAGIHAARTALAKARGEQ